jgi:hypothetical protein
VLEKLFSAGSLFRLLAQAKVDKVLESLAKVTLKLGRRVFRDQKKDLHGMDIGIWGLSICQLQSSDAKRPDIGFVVIARLLDDFGCHPEGSSHKCVLLGHGGGELSRNTKVGQLDLSI